MVGDRDHGAVTVAVGPLPRHPPPALSELTKMPLGSGPVRDRGSIAVARWPEIASCVAHDRHRCHRPRRSGSESSGTDLATAGEVDPVAATTTPPASPAPKGYCYRCPVPASRWPRRPSMLRSPGSRADVGRTGPRAASSPLRCCAISGASALSDRQLTAVQRGRCRLTAPAASPPIRRFRPSSPGPFAVIVTGRRCPRPNGRLANQVAVHCAIVSRSSRDFGSASAIRAASSRLSLVASRSGQDGVRPCSSMVRIHVDRRCPRASRLVLSATIDDAVSTTSAPAADPHHAAAVAAGVDDRPAGDRIRRARPGASPSAMRDCTGPPDPGTDGDRPAGVPAPIAVIGPVAARRSVSRPRPARGLARGHLERAARTR